MASYYSKRTASGCASCGAYNTTGETDFTQIKLFPDSGDIRAGSYLDIFRIIIHDEKYTKAKTETEAEEFARLFKNKSKEWSFDMQGNIIKASSNDKDVQAWLKRKGFIVMSD